VSFQIKSVSLSMGSKTLISDVSLTVAPGEFLAVLGPNGAGKSTLFKVMAGEYQHYSGSMILNDKAFEEYEGRRRASLVGVLPQSSQLSFAFTTYEVVMLGRLPHSSGRIKDREIAYRAMEQADVSHLAQALYPSLSGGEKQRVQLARVLCQIWDEVPGQSRYILLDEPTSALDLAHQHHTLSLAKELAAQGVGVLSILHDLNLAAQYADRLLLLGDGKVVAQGSVEEILTPDKISKLYGIDVEVIPHPKRAHPLVVSL